MYKKLNILVSGLALVLAMGCNGSTPTPKKGDSGAPVKHANKPGELDLSGVDLNDKVAKSNLAFFYLLAASSSPSHFLEKYAKLSEHTQQGLPETLQKSVQSIVKYIRTGGDKKKVENIKAHIKKFDKIPHHIVYSLPGESHIYFSSRGRGFANYTKSIHTLRCNLVVGGANIFSTAALFAKIHYERQISTPSPSSSGSYEYRQIPIDRLIHFTEPPAVISVKLSSPSESKYEKDIEISPVLTLPAACTTVREKAMKYKLVGAYDLKYDNGEEFITTTYFCWKGKQWYKIDLTGNDLKPQKVDKQEVLDTGKKDTTTGVITKFTYVYEMSKGGGKKQGK